MVEATIVWLGLQDVQSISTYLVGRFWADFVEKMLAIQAYIYCTTYEKSRIRLLTSTTCSHDVGKFEVTCWKCQRGFVSKLAVFVPARSTVILQLTVWAWGAETAEWLQLAMRAGHAFTAIVFQLAMGATAASTTFSSRVAVWAGSALFALVWSSIMLTSWPLVLAFSDLYRHLLQHTTFHLKMQPISVCSN